jgi:plastocyanin
MKKLTMSALLLVIVLMVAACGGGTANTGGDNGGTGAPAAQDVTINALVTLKWDPATLTAAVGQPLNITMTSDGALEHNFVWADDAETDFLHLNIGETTTGPASRTFDTAGTYEFYCDIPGHREAGMVGTATVN